ncbi:hypothetical protein ZOSMA_563G00040 [Zostera marina]|uniref:Uncharacterized protein n=1 Tax=Zostera marina TaxID=29655 RepID=A0A0K9NY16_ZOSMR|nr:hypothetical protein ZOSMA_563G00040 [Zostera marina]
MGVKWKPVRCTVGTFEKASKEASGEKFEYQAEPQAHKEVFLRELVKSLGDASDALDKLRFENKDSGASNDLIGQFVVGFYSAANKVVVYTKSPRSEKQYVWKAVVESSSYVIKEETDPGKLFSRGTQITLYLRVR